MCGISAVYYHTHTCTPPPIGDLESSLNDSLRFVGHRGPDSSGTWISNNGRVGEFNLRMELHSVRLEILYFLNNFHTGLGHVRLSVIGPENGDQPLSDESGNIQCVVNGELYGFERIRSKLQAKGSVFKTNSDSEIVIHLYVINITHLIA